jgi:hypothetical protein
MDYTTCALPFAFLIGFLLGIGLSAWCMHEKPKPQEQEQPTPNGLHVLREVEAVVEPQPLARYERECVQVVIDMEKRGTMW